jgi:hypothetical protein
MRIVNINVYFEDEFLHIRFDILGEYDTIIFDTHFFLHNLESFAIEHSAFHQGFEGRKCYQNTLKYALAFAKANLSSQSVCIDGDSFSVFDVSRSGKIVLINEETTYFRGRKQYQHHEVIFKLPPDLNLVMCLLSCLSIYANQYHGLNFGFEEHLTFNKNLEKGQVTPSNESLVILPLMQKILSLKNKKQAYAYKEVMDTLQSIATQYEDRKKHKDSDFTFLDFMNYEKEYLNLYGNFLKIMELYSRLNSEDNLQEILEQTKQLVTSLSKQEAHAMCTLFDFGSFSKKNLMKTVLDTVIGKQANDGGLFDESYTEIQVLKQAEITLDPDGKIRIINIQENRAYISSYIGERIRPTRYTPRELANPLEFENEIKCLGGYLGWQIEPGCEVNKQIVFNPQNTPIFIRQGFINIDIFKTLYSVYHRGNFFAQSLLAAENQVEESLKLLPKELLPEIIRNSDKRFKNFPPDFFNKAVELGIKNGEECYSKRPKYFKAETAKTIIIEKCDNKEQNYQENDKSNKDLSDDIQKNNILDAALKAVNSYLEWSEKGIQHRGVNGWFTWLRHGQFGRDRANALKYSLQNNSSLQQIQTAIDDFFNKPYTRFNNHSLASFLLDELSVIENSPWSDTNHYPEYKPQNAEAEPGCCGLF